MMATLSGIAPIVPSGGSWVAPTRLIGAKSTRSGWEFQSVAVRANASDVDGAPDQSQRLRLHLFVGKLAQEVEIAPLVSLQHMIEVDGAVAAPVLRTVRPERRGASLLFELRIIDAVDQVIDVSEHYGRACVFFQGACCRTPLDDGAVGSQASR